MLVFVTTVRHPANSRSYARVGRLLDATLRSVCRQSDARFRAVIVCNEPPSVTISDDRCVFVPVGFPAPSVEKRPQISYEASRRDKGTKCVIGTIVARELDADHIMFVDADDLMHRDLAAFANANPAHPGWFSPRGIVHTRGSGRVQEMKDGFDKKNGSTSILRADLVPVPNSLARGSTQSDIVDALGDELVDGRFGRHGIWQRYLGERGHIMEPLPFPAAVWEIGTGENRSGNYRVAQSTVPIDRSLADDFGLDPPAVTERIAAACATWVRAARAQLKRATEGRDQ